MISQTFLAVLSLTAVFLLTSKPSNRWGHVVGLASQPFWLYASFSAEQWGIFICAIAYTVMWIRGIKNNFYS